MTLSYDDAPFALPASKYVVVELEGNPVGKGRPKFWKGHAVTPPKTRSYENNLADAALRAMHHRAPLDGPLKVEVIAAFAVPKSWSKKKKAAALTGLIKPTGKPDIDNILKASADALNRVVWRDDAQVVIASISKRYSDRPRLRIEVEAVLGEAS